MSDRLSIVIGTLNRADGLRHAVESLLRQSTGASEYEILVVDNGSTDSTSDVCLSLMKLHQNLRYVREPALGLSNARNRGIAEARYDLIGFFDDDATAESGWIESYLRLFRTRTDVDAAGGPIVVKWPNGRPCWLPTTCEGYFGHCFYGIEQRLLSFPEYPFGSNMVIRRSALTAVGGFKDSVGPKGQNMMSAGEQDLFARLALIGTIACQRTTRQQTSWRSLDGPLRPRHLPS